MLYTTLLSSWTYFYLFIGQGNHILRKFFGKKVLEVRERNIPASHGNSVLKL